MPSDQKRFEHRWVSIKFKFLAVLLPLLLFPTLAFTLFIANYGSKLLVNQIYRSSTDSAKEASREIQLYLLDVKDDLLVLSEIIGKAHLSADQIYYSINNIVSNSDRYNHILQTNPDGRVLATSDSETTIPIELLPQIFELARNDFYIHSVVTMNPQTLFPQIYAAYPVKRLNTLDGYLISSINMRRLWEVANSIQFGKSGMAYIVDANGTYLTHKSVEHVLNRDKFPDPEILQRARVEEIVNIQTINISQYKVLMACKYISDLNIFVIVEMRRDEALHPIRNLWFFSLIACLFMVITGTLLGVMGTNKIIRPIQSLAFAFQRLGRGQLDTRLESSSNDEIGILTTGFNTMVDEMKDRRQHMAELQKQLKRSDQLATLGTVSATLAHELKTPLTQIGLITDKIINTGALSNSQQSDMNVLADEIDRLERTVNNTLGLARVTDSLYQLVDLRVIFQNIIALADSEIESRRITLSLKIDNPTPIVFGHQDNLYAVFLNIISNALDAVSDGGLIGILTKEAQDSSFVEIHIQDNGCGISEENLEEIFKPFYTAGKEAGTGLGLAIVKRIVEDHGGKIHVLSSVGTGTTFIVILPVRDM